MSLSSVFSCPYSLALPEQHDRQKQQEQQLEQQYHNHQQQQQQQQEPVASSTPLPTKEVQNSLQRRNVYVSGLPETYRAADFRELCQEFGRVEASKLCVDSKCRPTKGYGFALFYDEADAAWCIKNLNGRWIGGRSLQARIADAAATPAPLDPNSAHPPISRARPVGKPHRTPNTSPQSTPGLVEGPLLLTTRSIPLTASPLSSQDVTPPVTPTQMSLTPTLIPHGAPHPLPIPPLQQQQSQQGGAPLFYQTPLEQPLGYPVAAIPAQQGYMSLPSPFVPSSAMMGMPVYFAVPQSSGLPGGVPQQFVVPSNLMASGSYPQQLYSSLVFSP